MKRIMWTALALAACGGQSSSPSAPPEDALCSSMQRVCGMNAKGVAECPQTARTLRSQLGVGDYAKVERCARDATTCGAVFGCMVDSLHDGDGVDSPQATATECARLPAICSAKDAERTGEDCQRMIDNLRQDAPDRAKLATCIDAANNCFAAQHCIDQVWFDLH